MGEMVQLVTNNIELLLMIISGLFLLFLILLIIVLAKLSKLNKMYKFIKSGYKSGEMAEFLDKYIDKIENNTNRIIELEFSVDNLYRKQKQNFQKIGLEKYNAFDDIGGNLSYALAILDEENSGIIINNIFTRTESRNYIKRIINGKCDQQLSIEELAALNKAEKS